MQLSRGDTELVGDTCTLEPLPVLDELLVEDPTPGQLAVFYDGDVVVGSAWIENKK